MLTSQQEISWLTIDQWQTFVDQHPGSSIFHHRNWLELLSEQYGFRLRIPAIVVSDTIHTAIPLLETKSLKGKTKLISLPFTDYLPILAKDQSTLESLCELIQDEFRDQYSAIILRSDCAVAGLPNASHFVKHELRTDHPLGAIEAGFASAIKRNLRKANDRGLKFEPRNDATAVDIFYRLHVLTRRKLGVPVQSRTYFGRLYEKLIKPGLGFIGVVTLAEKPIAAVVLLRFNGRLVYKYAASDPAALEHRPNDCLVYNSIRIAAEQGDRCFDFGISDKSQEGLRRFKSKWGATENDIFYNYVVGEPETDDGPSSLVRIASKVIQCSPTFVCRALGKTLYRYSQ